MIFTERYHIIQQLGRGRYASVFLLRDKHLNEICAAKVYEWDRQDLQTPQMIEREIQILKKIRSIKVPRLLDVYREPGRIRLIMEYFPGSNLESLIKTYGPVEEGTALKWIYELCDILSQLHGMNPPIIHGDLKPENVILSPEGSLGVIDLGSACIVEDKEEGCNCLQKQEGNTVPVLPRTGTPGYVPVCCEPFCETNQTVIALDPSAFTVETDIYSLGAIGIFLVTGMHPKYWEQTKTICSKSYGQMVDACLGVGNYKIKNLERLKKEIRQRCGK